MDQVQGSATGRLTSSPPRMQGPSWLERIQSAGPASSQALIFADFSEVELRVAACLGESQ